MIIEISYILYFLVYILMIVKHETFCYFYIQSKSFYKLRSNIYDWSIDIRKNNFAFLFSVHNKISLSSHE